MMSNPGIRFSIYKIGELAENVFSDFYNPVLKRMRDEAEILSSKKNMAFRKSEIL